MKNDIEVKELIAKRKGFTIKVNKKKESITFIVDKGIKEITLEADELLAIIYKQLKTKSIAVAMSNVDTKTIDMVQTKRRFNFRADKVIEKDEVFQVEFTQPVPYPIAVAEKMYNKCLVSGEFIEKISVEKYEENSQELDKEIKGFVESAYQIAEDKKL
jgi:hypothetical protein